VNGQALVEHLNITRELVYLAGPYSHKGPAADWVKAHTEDHRHRQHLEAALHLLRQGIMVYSPITYSHPIFRLSQELDLDFGGAWEHWEALDTEMVDRSDRVWVLSTDGWKDSSGTYAEVTIHTMKEGTGEGYTPPRLLLEWENTVRLRPEPLRREEFNVHRPDHVQER